MGRGGAVASAGALSCQYSSSTRCTISSDGGDEGGEGGCLSNPKTRSISPELDAAPTRVCSLASFGAHQCTDSSIMVA